MHAGIRNAFMVVAMFAVCGPVFGQANAGTQLAKSIRMGESAVSSGEGRGNGMAWLRLAILYQDAARYEGAEKAFRKAMDLLKQQNRARYADALDHMGTMYMERGKFAKAEPLERRALTVRQENNDLVGIGVSYMHLSLVAYGKHDLRGAETDAEMAVSLLAPEHASEASAAGATPEEKMSALIDIALIQCAQGECGSAPHNLERALELAGTDYSSKSVPIGFLHFLLGYVHTKNGDTRGGLTLMKTGIDEMKIPMGWGHPTYIAALKEYGAVLAATGHNDEAAEIEENVVRLARSSRSPGSSVALGAFGMNALR